MAWKWKRWSDEWEWEIEFFFFDWFSDGWVSNKLEILILFEALVDERATKLKCIYTPTRHWSKIGMFMSATIIWKCMQAYFLFVVFFAPFDYIYWSKNEHLQHRSSDWIGFSIYKANATIIFLSHLIHYALLLLLLLLCVFFW